MNGEQGMQNGYKMTVRNMKKKDHSRILGRDGKILKWSLNKYGV
jgi:hypothetical protein